MGVTRQEIPVRGDRATRSRPVRQNLSLHLRGLRFVAAEVEAGADGDAVGPAAIGEDVVEGMVVDDIELGADAEVLGDGEVCAAAYAVEGGPVALKAGGSKLRDDGFLERIGGRAGVPRARAGHRERGG